MSENQNLRGGDTVSVVVCTFNGERFVGAQLESILAQTHPLLEIIVSDDASCDSTELIVRDFQRRHPSTIRWVQNERNLGVTANFERALSIAEGTVIFLSDQDDVWQTDKVAKIMARFASSTNVLLVHSDADLVDEQLRSLGATLFQSYSVSSRERELADTGRGFEALNRRNFVTGATAAIRRDLLQIARPFPREWIHDEWLAILASATGLIVRVDEPLILYRQHAGNQIGGRPRSLAAQLLRASKGLAVDRRGLLARKRQLVERLEAANGLPLTRWKAWSRAALSHAEVRAALPVRRWRRISLVLRELLARRYFLYSRGWKAAVLDLLEPIGPGEPN
jgi:glycosyltransferase involved in cell wall biosynthesis